MVNKTKTQMLSELMKVETKIGGYNGLRWLKSRPLKEVKECYEGSVAMGIISPAGN